MNMNFKKIVSIAVLQLIIMFVNVFPQNIEQRTNIPVDESTGLITYQDVVQTEGNRLELFSRAIAWVNSFYVNPTEATKVRNPESGILEILHRFKIYYENEDGVQMDAGMISYSLRIELREDRYRYTMNNFTLRQASRFPAERWLDKTDQAYHPNWDLYLGQLDDFAKQLLEDLKNSMEPEQIIKEEEW
jgi:hypothetical protein